MQTTFVLQLQNWQVFEFLFQNKYTADEDVDLEEVKASW